MKRKVKTLYGVACELNEMSEKLRPIIEAGEKVSSLTRGISGIGIGGILPKSPLAPLFEKEIEIEDDCVEEAGQNDMDEEEVRREVMRDGSVLQRARLEDFMSCVSRGDKDGLRELKGVMTKTYEEFGWYMGCVRMMQEAHNTVENAMCMDELKRWESRTDWTMQMEGAGQVTQQEGTQKEEMGHAVPAVRGGKERTFPEELNDDNFKKVVKYLVKEKFCDDKYNWTGTATLLGYLIEQLCEKAELKENDRILWKPFKDFWGENIKWNTVKSSVNDWKNKYKSPPKGDDKIDDILRKVYNC